MSEPSLPEGVVVVEARHKNDVVGIGDAETEIRVGGRRFVAYHEDFQINDMELVEETCMLGQKMLYYGDIFTEVQAIQAMAEQELKASQAAVYLELRRLPDKMTEKHMEWTVYSHPRVKQALIVETEAARGVSRATVWWKLIQEKAALVRMLGFRQSSELKKGY